MSNNNARFGATSWDEVETKTGKDAKKSRDLYLRLENGSNVVRVLTKPHEYLVHRVKLDPKDPGFGERVMSSMFHGEGDPLCEPPYNLKPKRRWLLGVIDRKTNSYRILDMSVQVLKGIQELVRDEDWGDPSQYDVDIKVDKNGGPTGYYTVIPKSKKALTPADLEIKQGIDQDELKRKCTPPTRKDVEARLEFLKNKRNGTNGATVVANIGSTSTEATAEAESTDEDFEFPAAN